MFRASLATLFVLTFCGASVAADYDVSRQAPRRYQRDADICHVRHCGPNRCTVVNVCGCPDRYSCHGLYDAYGPYGGRAYMSAYTRLY
jgi:hypothetical protein